MSHALAIIGAVAIGVCVIAALAFAAFAWLAKSMSDIQ